MSQPTVGFKQTSLTLPNSPDFGDHLGPLERKVAALQITDAVSHGEGLELGKKIKALQRFVKDLFADPKKHAHELHKSMTTNENKYLQPLDKTLSLLNAKVIDYQEREKRRAETEAREREAAAREIEETRQLEEAASAERAGDHDLAEAILETPISVVVAPEPELAKVAGASTRQTWGAEVVSLLALAKHVAESGDVHLIQANEVALNGLARALKENFRIPGVRAVKKIGMSYQGD